MTKRMLLLTILLTVVFPAWGQMTFKPETGLKPGDARPAETEEPDAKYGGAQYKRALGVYQAGKIAETIRLCDTVIKTYRTGPWVERSMLLKARAQFNRGQLKKADKTLAKLSKTFPGTTLTRQMTDLHISIGMAYLNQGKYAGVRILQEMIERNPYGPRADEAQFHIAGYYLGKGHYQEASDAYALVASQYRKTRYGEEALFMRAKTMYLSNEGPRRDPLPYEEAREGLQDYLEAYPAGRFAAPAQALMKKVADVLAHKQFLIAEYYRKQKKPRAAQRYYRLVVKKYPESRWAAIARKRLPAPAPPKPSKEAPGKTKPASAPDATTQPEKSGETKK